MAIARQIRPSPHGGWEICKPGTVRSLTQHASREDALRHARRLVDEAGGGPVVELDGRGRVVGVLTAQAGSEVALQSTDHAQPPNPTAPHASRLASAVAFAAGLLAARRVWAKLRGLSRCFGLGFGIGFIVFGDFD